MLELQMRAERRSVLPPVVHAVDVRDRDFRQLFVGDALQAADVHAVHLSHRRLVADTKGTDSTMLTEEVLILPCVEEIFRHLALASQQAEAVWRGDRRPKAGSPADRAVASVAALAEIEVCLEPYGSAVTAASIGPEHACAL